MLYVLYGENDFLSRRNLRAIVAAKKEGAALHRLTPDSATEETLANLLASERDLFGTKLVVVLDGLLGGDFEKTVLTYRETLAESKNLYILFEKKLDVATVRKFEKTATLRKFELPEDGAALQRWIAKEALTRNLALSANEIEGLAVLGDPWAIDSALETRSLGGSIADKDAELSPFELADALSSGDLRRAYAVYHRHLAAGVSAQELFWKLWWQAKTLVQVASFNGASPAEIKEKTGLHPFVIGKALRGVTLLGADKVELLFDSLFAAWRDARAESGSDLSLHLEKILLGRQ
ncbi:MAG: hypothetical protein HYT22_00675 [Candidatus Niyogibacteria bacterium]|nr:hypothetical protein [Candidatus Niyogibacteria bacterium]